MAYQKDLSERERFLIKLAIASTLDALKGVLERTEGAMHFYRDKTKDDPAKAGYYDIHRQFTQLGYELDHTVEGRMGYDPEMAGMLVVK